MAGLGEFDRIDRFFRPLARDWPGAFGLKDDAALMPQRPGHELVVTTDAMVEGVHYLPGADPGRLARKLLRVNLSDLAAMGAEPAAYTLTTVLPPALGEDWLQAFAAGLAADQTLFGLSLIGGDSVRTDGPAVLSVTAMGHAPAGRALRRSGARAGDAVFVTGAPGDAALGLALLREGAEENELTRRYHLPFPRLALGARLRGVASAALDLSDGLAGDLAHITEASGVAARIETARLPFSPAARALLAERPDLTRVALAGGDDYELLFTAPPERQPRLEAAAAETATPIARIGVIEAGSGLRFLDEAGREIDGLSGWRHY